MPRYGIFSIVLVIALFVADVIPSSGQQPSEFETPQMVRELPIMTEALINGHRMTAIVVEKVLSTDGEEGGDCWRSDIMVLTVFRDGMRLFTEEYCSAYELGWVKFYADKHGLSYLFLGYASGRGTRATSELLRIYSLGKKVETLADFETSVPVTEDENVSYVYRVTAPPGGGLIVDRQAAYWPQGLECCMPFPKSEQLRLIPR